MEIVIVTGLSGGGKSKAASFLEDMGFYIVDNMPSQMILKFAEFCSGGSSRYERVALVYDIRTAAGDIRTELSDLIHKLRQSDDNCSMLFLTADTDVILHRYKETRRKHPLMDDTCPLEEAVRKEAELLAPIRALADHVVDTSHTTLSQLRCELINIFGSGDDGAITVSVTSFGFKYGIPMDSDLVFDVRFLPNPFYVMELRGLTGLDRPVRDYVFSFPETNTFMEHIRALLAFSLPLYQKEGKSILSISVGCTGGRHRSTALTHAIAECVGQLGYHVLENHRDINRGI